MPKKEILNFSIQNTTGASIPVNILGNPSDLADNANATTAYIWDVTTFALTTENKIELQYAMANALTFQTITISFSGNTRQDVVNALNTLNLGGFGLLNAGVNWYIFNYNLTYKFGWLNIYNPLVTPTTLTGFLVDAADTLDLKVNAVIVASFAGAVPLSGTYSAAIGDTMNVSGTTGALGFTLKVIQYPDNILLFNSVIAPATPYTFSWVTAATKNYVVDVSP